MENELTLIDPLHIRLLNDGKGDFPDSYIVTSEGLEKIKEYLNKLNN